MRKRNPITPDMTQEELLCELICRLDYSELPIALAIHYGIKVHKGMTSDELMKAIRRQRNG